MSEGYIIEVEAIDCNGSIYRTYRLAVTVGAGDDADTVDVEHIDSNPDDRMTFSFKASKARSCLEHLAEAAKEAGRVHA